MISFLSDPPTDLSENIVELDLGTARVGYYFFGGANTRVLAALNPSWEINCPNNDLRDIDSMGPQSWMNILTAAHLGIVGTSLLVIELVLNYHLPGNTHIL